MLKSHSMLSWRSVVSLNRDSSEELRRPWSQTWTRFCARIQLQRLRDPLRGVIKVFHRPSGSTRRPI
jgi:hypothetical protein